MYITCPNCNTYGKYTFPIEKKETKKMECFESLGDKCFTRLKTLLGITLDFSNSLLLTFDRFPSKRYGIAYASKFT